MKKKLIITILLLLADFGLLILFIAFVPSILINTVGFDCVEYENWDGALSDPIVLKFGAGCMEITIIVAKFLAFLAGSIVLCIRKKLTKPFVVMTIIGHIIIFILGIAYVFRFAEGPNALFMLSQLIE